MREILFRGKRQDNGAWETGSLVIVRMGCHDAQYYIADKMTGYHTPVDPSTVGQYTGKTDKDKNRVFDGDIIRMFNAKPPFDVGIVQWDDHDQCYVVRSTWSERCHLTDFGNLGRPEYFEIIGNIHDNPELLKGGVG